MLLSGITAHRTPHAITEQRDFAFACFSNSQTELRMHDSCLRGTESIGERSAAQSHLLSPKIVRVRHLDADLLHE